MAEELGAAIEIDGEPERAFPTPSRLARLEDFPGLFGRKVEYLRSLGEAATGGELDAAYLRSSPTDEALGSLKKLPGIGDFSAELILLRGAGEPDHLPTNEPRLRKAVALAYGLDELPATEDMKLMAEHWRPYRTWMSVYLRAMLEDETGETSGKS